MESARAAGGEGVSEEVAFELRCECSGATYANTWESQAGQLQEQKP